MNRRDFTRLMGLSAAALGVGWKPPGAPTFYYVDGYHGGVNGHMPPGAWRDVLNVMRALPEWKISLEIEPVSWDVLQRDDPEAYDELQSYLRDDTAGAAMDLMNLAPSMSDYHSLLLTLAGATPRDFYEQVRLGLEYTFMNTLSLRAGYVTPADEEGLSVGGGVHLGVSGIEFRADYAYSQFGIFGSVQRFAFQFGL